MADKFQTLQQTLFSNVDQFIESEKQLKPAHDGYWNGKLNNSGMRAFEKCIGCVYRLDDSAIARHELFLRHRRHNVRITALIVSSKGRAFQPSFIFKPLVKRRSGKRSEKSDHRVR